MRNNIMRIAVPIEDGKIYPHFGNSRFFKFYNVEDGTILQSFSMASGVEGHEEQAAFLKAAGAQLLICGGIGGGAMKALDKAGILVMGGIVGDADERIREFLNGTIQYRPAAPGGTCANRACHHHSGTECSHGHEGAECDGCERIEKETNNSH
ncbi:MAG: NifB/NifX family molybdenum-iron cluster-binding protein [Clostridiales bacterium]|nr:NifB/NifX family molybdenum-iron cluster-binding protein [Clostridiales bacterium]